MEDFFKTAVAIFPNYIYIDIYIYIYIYIYSYILYEWAYSQGPFGEGKTEKPAKRYTKALFHTLILINRFSSLSITDSVLSFLCTGTSSKLTIKAAEKRWWKLFCCLGCWFGTDICPQNESDF